MTRSEELEAIANCRPLTKSEWDEWMDICTEYSELNPTPEQAGAII